MAESCSTNDAPPVSPFVLAPTGNEVSNTVVTDVLWICNHVIDAARQIHDAEGVFESAVRSGRIDKIRQGELMDMPEALKRPRVNQVTLLRVQLNEPVDWVPDFVDSSGHVNEIVLLWLKHFQQSLLFGEFGGIERL
jgi:hypothetical protein